MTAPHVIARRAEIKELLESDLALMRPRFVAVRGKRLRRRMTSGEGNSKKDNDKAIGALQDLYMLSMMVLSGRRTINEDGTLWRPRMKKETNMDMRTKEERARDLKARDAVYDARRKAKESGQKVQPAPIPLRVDDDWRSLKAHPLANMLPMMDEATKASLGASIQKHGCTEPGVLYEGMILDGRNRHAVCKALDVPFPTRQFDPSRDGEPFDFVLRHNVERRQLTKLQLCIVALPFVTSTHGGDRRSVSSGNSTTCFSLEQAAVRFSVSAEYMRKVRTLLRHCSEEEHLDLFNGKVTLAKMRDAKGLAKRPEAEEEGPSIAEVPVIPEPTSMPQQPVKVLTDNSPDEELFAGWDAGQEVASTQGGSVVQRLREEMNAPPAVSGEPDVEEETAAPATREQKERIYVQNSVQREVVEDEVSEQVERPASRPTPAKRIVESHRIVIEVPEGKQNYDMFLLQLNKLVKSFQLSMTTEPMEG